MCPGRGSRALRVQGWTPGPPCPLGQPRCPVGWGPPRHIGHVWGDAGSSPCPHGGDACSPSPGPPFIVSPPENITVNISQDALFTCQAEAYPGNLTYLWYWEEENVYFKK